MNLLAAIAARAQWVLVAGLVVGIAFPAMARAMAPAIVPLVAVMLVLAAVREGPGAVVVARPALRRVAVGALVLQGALPVVVGAALFFAGWLDHPLGIATVLAVSASPITGAPGLAVLSNADAGHALRHLAVGTVLLPITAIPALTLLPVFPTPEAILWAVGRLLVLLAVCLVASVVLLRLCPGLSRPEARPALGGLMALAMGIVVIGLMSEIRPALVAAPGELAAVFALAVALYLAQTLGAWGVVRGNSHPARAKAIAILAGNRNLALFLAAIPSEAAAPLMVFIGCYQVPMYLTPLLLARLPDARTDG